MTSATTIQKIIPMGSPVGRHTEVPILGEAWGVPPLRNPDRFEWPDAAAHQARALLTPDRVAMHPWEALWNMNWTFISWIVALVLLGLLSWVLLKRFK